MCNSAQLLSIPNKRKLIGKLNAYIRCYGLKNTDEQTWLTSSLGVCISVFVGGNIGCDWMKRNERKVAWGTNALERNEVERMSRIYCQGNKLSDKRKKKGNKKLHVSTWCVGKRILMNKTSLFYSCVFVGRIIVSDWMKRNDAVVPWGTNGLRRNGVDWRSWLL